METERQNMDITALFIKEFIKRLKEEIKDTYISLSIVSTTDGMVLIYDSKDPSINNKGSGTYQFGIMKSVAMGLKKMKKEEDQKQEIYKITVTYEGQKHILALSATRKFMIHLILESEANMVLIMKYMEKLTGTLIREYTAKIGAENVNKVDITSY